MKADELREIMHDNWIELCRDALGPVIPLPPVASISEECRYIERALLRLQKLPHLTPGRLDALLPEVVGFFQERIRVLFCRGESL